MRLGVSVDVATTDDGGPGGRLDVPRAQRIERDGYGLYYFRKQTEFYKVSLPFRGWVRRHVSDYDLLHIHALFSHTSIAAARAARHAGVPYVVRPLGVLNRWGMENRRRVLKSLSFRFIEQPVLRHAASIHYTSRAEQLEAEACGVRAFATILPLGIDVLPYASEVSPERFYARFPQAKDRDIVLFLSRVDAKKGVDLLLAAFARLHLKFPKCLLVIAGSGEAEYVQSLRRQAEILGIDGQVVWAGFLGGHEKLAAFAAASVFTLPSHSENFGIALVEALAAGLACVTTPGVAVSEDMSEWDAGLIVPCDVLSLAQGLERILADAALGRRLGVNARRLAKDRFSMETMGRGLHALYQHLLDPSVEREFK